MRILTLATLAALATPAAAQTLLIGNKGEDTISFVDLETGREIARRPTGRMPHEIAVSRDGRRAAVVAYGGNTIDLFDVRAARKLTTIDLGTNTRPHGLVWLHDGRIVATTEGSDTLTVIEPDRSGGPRVRAIPTGQKGSHMVATSAERVAYVANMQSGTFSRIDLNNDVPVRSIAAGEEPEGIALAPERNRLWVADRKRDIVRVFNPDTGAQITSFPTGRMPIRIVITSDGTRAYVSNAGAGTISVYDARALQPAGTIMVSGKPEAMQVTLLLARDEQHLYAAETGTNTIAEISLRSNEVVRRLPAGKQGDGLAVSRLDVEAPRFR